MTPTVLTQIDGELADLIDELRNRRRQIGFTLKDIEARTGISFVTISKLENLKTLNPRWVTIMAYADAVGLKFKIAPARK